MEALKNLIAALLSLIALLGSFVVPETFVPPEDIAAPAEYTGETLTLAEDGQSDYVIVCAKAAGDPEYTAAVRLRDYLEQISGAALPIVSDAVPPTAHEIIVGRTNREDGDIPLDRSDFGDETLRYFTDGERLVLAGGEKRGTLYSVYEFLKNELDCRWYTKNLIVIPEKSIVKIPAALDYTYAPVLEYRSTDWISTNDAEYCLANHINAKDHMMRGDLGGAVYYSGGFCHTFTNTFVNADTYFDSHPEYFALYLGKRTRKQLCLSNPDVLALVIQEVRELLEREPDAQIISLTQGDTVLSYCQCRDCLALDAKNGSHAGTMISFVNQVAETFAEAYPNLKFDTFAYRYTRTAPSDVKPRDNVIVRLCSIECCFSHPLNAPGDLLNTWFCRDIENWSQISRTLYIWDYTTNYWNYLGPFPNFGVLQANMQFFVEHNVRGVYEEGNYQAQECDAEFAELRCYLLSRLMFDPYCDYEAEMDGFLKAYYGAGWQYVKEYIRMTTEHTGTNGRHMIIYHDMIDGCVLDFSIRDTKYCDALWENAKALCADETTLERVARSELSWRYWKACNMRGEFSRIGNALHWKEAQQRLLDDYRRFGVTRLTEPTMLAEEPNLALTPDLWGAGPRISF